jgi:regulation of enolase protein 1 (concanavalin A-like superfamily)
MKKLFLFVLLGLYACKTELKDFEDSNVKIGEVVFGKILNQGLQSVKADSLGSITMYAGPKTDFFNEPDGSIKYSNAPIILKKIRKNQSFTFIIKVRPSFEETYDAGAVYLYNNQNQWVKFAFEMDEQKNTRLVTVRTNEVSDDNNHDVVADKSVFLKVSTDSKSIGYYYSKDRKSWQLVRLHKNDFPDSYFLGLSSQSPIGKGTVTRFSDAKWEDKSVKDFRKGQ